MIKLPKMSLLAKVAIAIVAGILFGQFLPNGIVRVFVTFNSLFANFLSFSIPLIILGLVIPAIGELGRGAGRMLLLTTVIAYGSTLFSAFFTYSLCSAIYPHIIDAGSEAVAVSHLHETALTPYFTIAMPPVADVMTALILAFAVGLGLSHIQGDTLRKGFADFREIVVLLIRKAIIPLLPLHIFGLFLNMTVSGEVAGVISTFIKVIAVIFVLHILLLVIQFTIAGAVSRRNPFKLLWTMMPAYATALGTASSAATIPVTLAQTLKNGVSKPVAEFVVPLCATVHLAGSAMKVTALAIAMMFLTGRPVMPGEMSGFILLLGVTMVAAPGIPGGAIMAALGLLQSMLGFDETCLSLIVAIYVAIDSFGTACNVTGDGAIAVVVDRISRRRQGDSANG